MRYVLDYADSFWPDHLQTLLLQAILSAPGEARAAWGEWRSSFDLKEERIDAGTFRLLPMLYRRLKALGVEDAHLGILKGLYRNTWYKNQLLLLDLRTVLERLGQAGIPAIVLKGAALSLAHYRDPGSRPMDDVDVLVRPEKILEAVKIMEDMGWYTEARLPQSLDFEHAVSFRNPHGRSLDLHQFMMHECCHTDGDRDFWDASETLEHRGLKLRIPDPSALLLHVLIHGLRPQTPVNWIVDAVVVMGSMDSPGKWERFTQYAEARRLSYQAGLSLQYLLKNHPVSVPPEVLRRLAVSVRRVEYFEYRCKTSTQGILGVLPELCSRYYLRVAKEGSRRGVGGFLRYLQHYFSCERVGELPFLLAKKGLENVREKMKCGAGRACSRND